jgi:hypothetical protein
MDIRARDLLGRIRKISPQAVIAGGAVRDDLLGVEPKDYDFFIPFKEYPNVVREFNGGKRHPKSKDYTTSHSDISDVYQFEYEGIKVELMRSRFDPSEDFGQKVIQSFDFGICMAYYEGSSLIRDTDKFQEDVKNGTMTLYKLQRISDLPRSIDRFNRLNGRLGGRYKFTSPRLQLLKDEDNSEKTEKTGLEVYSNPYKMVGDDVLWARPVPRARIEPRPLFFNEPGMANPAAEIPLIADPEPDRIPPVVAERPRDAWREAVDRAERVLREQRERNLNQRLAAIEPIRWEVEPARNDEF